MALLTMEQQQKIADLIRDIEARTDAELVTVLAAGLLLAIGLSLLSAPRAALLAVLAAAALAALNSWLYLEAGLVLPLAAALALAGVLPWWLVAVRWALGAAALTAALRTTGTLRAWPAVWLYEAAASTMAVAVALRSRRAHAIEWGGVTYRRHPAVAVETVGGTL